MDSLIDGAFGALKSIAYGNYYDKLPDLPVIGVIDGTNTIISAAEARRRVTKAKTEYNAELFAWTTANQQSSINPFKPASTRPPKPEFGDPLGLYQVDKTKPITGSLDDYNTIRNKLTGDDPTFNLLYTPYKSSQFNVTAPYSANPEKALMNATYRQLKKSLAEKNAALATNAAVLATNAARSPGGYEYAKVQKQSVQNYLTARKEALNLATENVASYQASTMAKLKTYGISYAPNAEVTRKHIRGQFSYLWGEKNEKGFNDALAAYEQPYTDKKGNMITRSRADITYNTSVLYDKKAAEELYGSTVLGTE
jgi:hypothetical protein